MAEDAILVSRDAAVRSGDWAALSSKYPNPYAEAGIPAESEGPGDVPLVDLASWWSAFEDETLTQLITWALEGNRNLAAARSKVTESRASLGISRSALLPWLDNTDSWTTNDQSKNSTGAGRKLEISRLGIDASWEIDIFGERRHDIDAGIATLEADHAALHAAWVTLSSEVALNYLTLRTLQERLDIARQNLRLQTDTMELLQSRHNAGLSDELALNQARYAMEQTRAAIPPVNAGIEEAMNAMALLVGAAPGSLEGLLGYKKPLPKLDAAKLVGIPANSLRQRPDIRASELRLVAQTARKKSAEADLLPRFYLAGSIGLESLRGGGLLSSDSFGFSFGPRITLPIFHGEAIRGNIRVQGAREEQLLAAYEQTVLAAVAEVRDALASTAQEAERNKSLKSGVEAARAALEIALGKYNSGLTDFSNVISAQRALLSLEEQSAISDGQMTSNAVRIFKALGGGWAPLVAENLKEQSSAAE
jgi:NodT family efflux transporter outer membrane factor (OMF) lipoprotein